MAGEHKEVMLSMEKKVTTSPIGKASTGNAAAHSGKTPTGPASKTPTAVKPSTKPAEKHEIKQKCHEHMHRYVLVQTKDGWCCDGFVEHVDEETVCIAVPFGAGMDRAFFPGPFYPSLYPYPYYPRRRFYRQVFPLGALLGLSLLPYY